jgi:hypothetical protein
MSHESRAYCQRRIERIDRQLAERRRYVGPLGSGNYASYTWYADAPPNVDGLLEQRAMWMRLLSKQS